MSPERFVVLGAARAQSGWFGAVARWSNSAALPVEFVKALSADEVRVRLRNGRPYSAVLVDGGLVGWDRDLTNLAQSEGCRVVIVDRGTTPRSWRELGADAVLAPDFSREELLDTLEAIARPIARVAARDPAPTVMAADAATSPGQGQLAAVTGAAGTGRSTLAMALASGLAGNPLDRGLVVVADLALHAQQGVLHDAGDVLPGLPELVEAHRGVGLDPEGVRRMCFQVADRGYDLLLGLRRHRDWVAIRPTSCAAALDGLRRAYRLVVADVDADVEGEAESGSIEVEERNTLARTSLHSADVVVVVGLAGVTGMHALVRAVTDLLDFGVEPARLVPVINKAPRNPRARAELVRALNDLVSASGSGRRSVPLHCGPLFVPERRRLDDVVRSGTRLPAGLVDPLTSAVRGLLDQMIGGDVSTAHAPVAVRPGTVGKWTQLQREAVR